MSDITLFNKEGKILASSREVAEKFGKSHNHVLRDIEDIISKSDCPNLDSEMFVESIYQTSRGKIYKCYLMNRDGFSLLAIGFTGKKALEWKLKYIKAFNEMEEKLKTGSYLSEEEKLKLQLFSKYPLKVVSAHKRLVELEVGKATAPLILKAEYPDEVLNKNGLITTTVIAKDLGFKSATKLNQILNLNHILFKNQSGTWCPYAEYEWLITENYADYQSYGAEKAKPCLKWTERGRKWIIENYNKWVKNLIK